MRILEIPIFNPDRRHWFGVGVGLLILASLGLRLAPIGRYVTPDEPAWVYRSVSFLDALLARDWSAVPETGHPGVTTMWLGSSGVLLRRLVASQDSVRHLAWVRQLAWLAPENGEAFRHLAPFLAWGRVLVAVLSVLGLVALYVLLARLFDRRVGWLVFILLAFDPFLIGHSGLLHTDALLALFSLLALITALSGLKDPHRAVWWAISGLFVALALLTKTPALILLPFILSMLVTRHLYRMIRRMEPLSHCVPHAMYHGSLFVVSSFIAFFIVYPALWTDPLSTVRKLFAFAGDHVQMAQRPIFFAGRMMYDPGPVFYPTVVLFRVSPLVLLGLMGVLLCWRDLTFDRRFACLALLAFAILFGAGMSLGAKKHDRYLLPVFPSLAVAGALGWRALLDRYASRWLDGGSLLIALPQVLTALLFAAYPLTYFNPLLGGPRVASRMLPTGWGEAAGGAARWLNRLPHPGQLTVAASNVPSFAALFEGRTVPLDPDALALADYVVATSADDRFVSLPVYQSISLPGSEPTAIYTSTASFEQADYLSGHAGQQDLILVDADTPLQRRYERPGLLLSAASIPDEATMADWLAEHVPAHQTTWLVASAGASPITAAFLRRQLEAIATPVTSATVSSATIIQFVPSPSPSATRAPPYRAAFGGRLALVDTSFQRHVARPDSLSVTLRWQALAAPLPDYQAVVALRDGDGHTWADAESLVRDEVNFPTSTWQRREWSDMTYELPLPPGIPPVRYAVEVSLYDRATGARLGAVEPDGGFRGTRFPVGEARVIRPVEPPDVAALDMTERLDVPLGPLILLGADPPPEQVASGDYLSFALVWEADADPEVNYDIRLEWVGSGDQVESEAVEPLSPYPTSYWQAGDRFQSHYRVHASPEMSAGRYRLMLGLLHPAEGDTRQPPIPLATVEILPRKRSFMLPDGDFRRLNLRFGEQIHLCGFGIGDAEVTSGETLPLTLCWRADGSAGAIERSFTVFVHLLGPDGLVRGQVDRLPGGGGAPTNSWAPGQVVVDEIDLPVDADAPAGSYQVAVGFYDAFYGERLPVIDSSGKALPGGRAILPVEIVVSR